MLVMRVIRKELHVASFTSRLRPAFQCYTSVSVSVCIYVYCVTLKSLDMGDEAKELSSCPAQQQQKQRSANKLYLTCSGDWIEFDKKAVLVIGTNLQ